MANLEGSNAGKKQKEKKREQKKKIETGKLLAGAEYRKGKQTEMRNI